MSGVDRVHVRCAAPPEEEARALRLRDRLVRTARIHLPEALERALAGGPERRVFAERVAVELDFDPDDYDDVTTALLWAGRVRRALDARDEPASGAAGVAVFEDDREYFGAAAVEFALSGGLRWIFEELACGTGSPEPAAFLAAFDTRERVAALARALSRRFDAAAALWQRLSASERRAALEALAGVRAWGDWSVAAEAPSSPDAPGELGAPPAPAGPRAESEPLGHRSAPSPTDAADGAEPAAGSAGAARPGPQTAALDDWLTALAQCARTNAAGVRHSGGRHAAGQPLESPAVGEAETSPRHSRAGVADSTEAETRAGAEAEAPESSREEPGIEPTAQTWWSNVGGLVLLYPWLADLLAEEVEPSCELAFRSWALAAVIAPEAEQPLLVDPLVRVLAGDDPAAPFRPLLRPTEPDDLVERGEGVLRSFAAALPGFEGSTPGYLRQFMLVRGALVASLTEEDGFGVRLEPGPLDPALAWLPYPLGPFRFAWSAPVHVELRDARG